MATLMAVGTVQETILAKEASAMTKEENATDALPMKLSGASNAGAGKHTDQKGALTSTRS